MALRLFLHSLVTEQTDMDMLSFNTLKNDIIDTILRQNTVAVEVAQQLVDMCNDPEQDGVWRQYCLQYMCKYYERADSGLLTRDSEASCVRIRDELWSVVGEKEDDAAGTALLCLERLSRNHPDVRREAVAATAYRIVVDIHHTEAARISALRICGLLGQKDVLPMVRKACSDASGILRLAAIAVLGELGTSDDEQYLEDALRSSDERVRSTADVARRRLSRSTL